MHIESLDARQLLNGGVDPSFGGDHGLKLDVPGFSYELVNSSLVDSAGRTILYGSTDIRAKHSRAMIVRLTPSGELDRSFGKDGVLQGTPRGIIRYQQLIPLREGGFIALANRLTPDGTAPAWPILVRLRADGTIDETFGKKNAKGIVSFPTGMTVSDVVARSDGKIWLIGQKDLHGEGATSLVVARLNANGTADASFGIKEIGARGESDLLYGASTQSLHATLTDGNGLALLVKESSSSYDWPEGGVLNSEATISVYRVLPDDRIRSIQLQNFSAEAPDRVPDIDLGRLVMTGTDTLQAIYGDMFALNKTVRLVNINLVTSAKQSTDITSRLNGFDWTGAAVRLLDGTILLGGSDGAYTGGNASVLKLNPDLSRDTSFGSNGILQPVPEQVPNIGLVNTTRSLEIMPDGRVAAFMVGDYGDRAGHSYVVAHLFRDDRPVASLVRSKSDDKKHRVVVQYRAAKPIDIATLGNDDLRLQDAKGRRYTLRLLSYVRQGDTIVGTYTINRSSIPSGTFSVRTIAGAVQTTGDDELLAKSIGSVTLV